MFPPEESSPLICMCLPYWMLLRPRHYFDQTNSDFGDQGNTIQVRRDTERIK